LIKCDWNFIVTTNQQISIARFLYLSGGPEKDRFLKNGNKIADATSGSRISRFFG
jgi:hypothetical protein